MHLVVRTHTHTHTPQIYTYHTHTHIQPPPQKDTHHITHTPPYHRQTDHTTHTLQTYTYHTTHTPQTYPYHTTYTHTPHTPKQQTHIPHHTYTHPTLAHHSPHRLKLHYQACSLQEDRNVFTPLFLWTSHLPPSWGLLIRLIPPTVDAKGLGACPDSLTRLVGQGRGTRSAVGHPAFPDRMRSTHQGAAVSLCFRPTAICSGKWKMQHSEGLRDYTSSTFAIEQNWYPRT